MQRKMSLYDRYMEYAEQFELEYRRASSGQAHDMADYPKRHVIAPGRRFTPPDWGSLYTYRQPAMNENAYVDKIIKQAQADKTNGKLRNSQGYSVILNSFLQCASPDRIAIYNDSMRHTGGRMNATFKFFDEFGHTVLRWNPGYDWWECTLTSLEKARMKIFSEIYDNALLSATNRPAHWPPPSPMNRRS